MTIGLAQIQSEAACPAQVHGSIIYVKRWQAWETLQDGKPGLMKLHCPESLDAKHRLIDWHAPGLQLAAWR